MHRRCQESNHRACRVELRCTHPATVATARASTENWCCRMDSDHRPSDYKSDALPLSYNSILADYCELAVCQGGSFVFRLRIRVSCGEGTYPRRRRFSSPPLGSASLQLPRVRRSGHRHRVSPQSRFPAVYHGVEGFLKAALPLVLRIGVGPMPAGSLPRRAFHATLPQHI